MSPSAVMTNGYEAANGYSTKTKSSKLPTMTTNEATTTNDTQPPPRAQDVIGYHEALKFGGDRLQNNVAKIVQQCPRIGSQIVAGMSSNLGTTSLSYRDWSLVTLATLTAMGDCTDQLNVYVEGGLKNGVTVEEILDVYQHAASFVGTPRAVNALRATWDVLSKVPEIPLPPTYTESLVRLGDHDTLVRDTHGEGIPIVLAHCLSMDGRMWRDIIPALSAQTGARVIAYDIRGHGYARGVPLTKNLQHLCQDLGLLLDTLAIPQIDLYGASFGGSIAQLFALDYPQRVRSLSPIAISARSTPALLTRATRAEEHGVESLLAESIIRWFRPETIALNPWCVRYARGCVEHARVQDWAAAWRAMAYFNHVERLAELKIPVLALSGKLDASAIPELMQELASACVNADCEFLSIDQGTHMMILEEPKLVVEALTRFRRKVDRLAGRS